MPSPGQPQNTLEYTLAFERVGSCSPLSWAHSVLVFCQLEVHLQSVVVLTGIPSILLK